MNARGIRPAAYQVLHMLSYPGGGGGGVTPSQGTPIPHPDLAPSMNGVPPGKGTGTSHWGAPRKDMGPVEVLWDRDGVTPLPPPGVNWQTNWNYYLPYPSDTGFKNPSGIGQGRMFSFCLFSIRMLFVPVFS